MLARNADVVLERAIARVAAVRVDGSDEDAALKRLDRPAEVVRAVFRSRLFLGPLQRRLGVAGEENSVPEVRGIRIARYSLKRGPVVGFDGTEAHEVALPDGVAH